MKKFILLAIVLFIALSCNKQIKQENPKTERKKEINNFSKTTLFEGTLPCADCSGIKTVLKIYNDYSVSQNNKFELISTYEGKQPNNTFTQKGNFNTERGLENDPDGTIYVLNWDQPEDKQIYYGYYSKNPEKLYLLDKNRKIIQSELNYSLIKK
ncbi:copper resistance protein NlpE [Flavobacterium ustbae]|uniref:copper resistance protein NlpE n=1 Tax=Flavobacterium ustbae TaxID=2488790 RepID=UPI000F7B25AE|nr:copper resistance protein NlpE [Flavobacterium ustbae]